MTKKQGSPSTLRLGKMLVVASVIALSACGGSPDSQAQTTSGSETPAQAIQRLEQSGQLPILDRSADLKGPDADNNGIRDDIDAYIAKQPYTPAQKSAATQYAKAMQQAITTDPTNSAAVRAADQQANRAIHCLWNRFTSNPDAASVVSTYEKLTANTEVRTRAYLGYNKALDGTVSSQPRGDTCDQ
ncbi:hypothetical protein [Ralstonia pseudosolanacearum]|uniref:hypothetical protein n=1 Tax=Ralstonia pseudosolanacearum TaxID=1310165 RepID=UPI003CEA836B